ncbi:S1C family serine protease [Cellulomonas wangsupingiae]|uniref:S1C family serine protease n=1 Tax=Cellulomonas wangsupingiae TaxID=2968085 RepID=UPI001D0F40C6|nr:trypsin-like peptidase domain-containing protein [Cellulomonas wangsupingiae]MCM0641487.1 trypsin-like peptidase domain-containing protein [Cellulomonas wangsupingiae]
MTTTPPSPQPGGHPQEHPTQPLPPHGSASVAAEPRPQDTTARLTPAQEWARYESAHRAARGPGDGGAGVPPRAPGQVPPGSDPWATPAAPAPAPQKRSRAWLWITSAAVAGLLVGGGSVAVSGVLDDADRADRAASLSDVGRSGNDEVPVSGSSAEDPDWRAVAAAVQASVVAIQVQTQSGGGQGSGVIIDDAGHVLTNNHVVSGAQGNVQVTLTDGRILEGEVVGTDASTDLAVVELIDPPDDLQAAAFGDSDDVTVGDPVMAVGNPLGLANTVTTGIVSAVDRPVSTQEDGGTETAVTNAIQIDAAINPGNSGGPLFDATGQVIGITSSIATLSAQSGSIGLGFAIPSNQARSVAAQLMDDGVAEHAFLGVSLSDGTATADGVTRRGAVVESVTEGSPAAEAGLRAGDVIVAVGDDPVGGAESLTAFVRAMSSGDEATLTVVRDGQTIEVDVTLATRPDAGDQLPQQDQGGQGQGDQGGLPGGITPEQLWEWLQQQQGRG